MEASRKKVASSINGKFKSLRVLPKDRCIFRVPEYQRKLYEEAYRPFVVSIGPFYCDDSQLQAMKEQKLRYLQSFLERSSNNHKHSLRCFLERPSINNHNHSLEDYIKHVGEWEEDIRQSYAEKIRLTSEEFIEMILVDAAFIIELILRCPRKDVPVDEYVRVQDSLIFGKPKFINEVYRDVLLQENQLPFFILTRLYDLSCGMATWSDESQSFMNLAYPITESWGRFIGKVGRNNRELLVPSNIKNLVDLLRISFLPSNLEALVSTTCRNPKMSLPLSATELKAAGVRFKSSKDKNLLDIKFDKNSGKLEIPKLMLPDDAESIFRSMVMFERCCCCDRNSYIIHYIVFLDDLIKTSKDVELLVNCGIIDNGLGSPKEVANLFNKIHQGVAFDSSKYYYAEARDKLEIYAHTTYHRWRATLVEEHFDHPWAIISLIYALVLLILTIIQTVTSFKK